MGLQLGLEGASSVCGQESCHRGRAERIRAEVAGALLDVVFDEDAALDRLATHLLLQLGRKLGPIQPHLRVLALVVLHSLSNQVH